MKVMTGFWWTPTLPILAVPLVWREVLGRPTARLHARNDRRTISMSPESGQTFVPGESSTGRTTYTVVSMFCAMVLATLLGFRIRTLQYNVIRKSNFTSVLVLFLFFDGLGFTLSAAIVEHGQGLSTHAQCYSAIIICLVFYTGNKLTIYLFLLERARIVRAPFMPRKRDWVWVAGMIIIIGGFGAIAMAAYLSPYVEVSKIDGRCRIGFPPRISLPLLAFDIGINILLTGTFFWLLRPVLLFHGLSSMSGICDNRVTRAIQRYVRKYQEDSDDDSDSNVAVNQTIRALLRKSLIGSTWIMLPTVANLAQFYSMGGRELAWVCLSVCTVEVTWAIIVVNWLTIGSAEAEKNLTRITTERAQESMLTVEQPSSLIREISVLREVPVFVQEPGRVVVAEMEVNADRSMHQSIRSVGIT